MVYDPIRDCEVPSPAVSNPGRTVKPWELDTPQSSYSPGPRGGSHPPSASASASLATPGGGPQGSGRAYPHGHGQGPVHPPAWQHAAGGNGNGSSSPSMRPSRSISGGLRSLMNDDVGPASGGDNSRRSSTRTSLSEDDDRAAAGGRGGSMHYANYAPTAPGISQSTSNSSLHSATSASNMSPPAHHRSLEAPGFLAPFTPAPSGHRVSRLSYATPASVSPVTHPSSLPPHEGGYPGYYDTPSQAGPSRSRRTSVSNGPRPMLPPGLPRPADFAPESARSTPTVHSHGLPLRSPSVSISPRSNYVGLPAGGGSHPTSRPGSSTSNTFSFHPPPLPQAASPPVGATRRLSEDPHQQRYSEEPQYGAYAPPADAAPRRSTVPVGRSSMTPSLSHNATPVRSPSPVKRTPYAPKRLTQPDMLYRPILSDEISELRAIGQSNNPLRHRKRKRPLPSWSGTPRSQATPSEMDTSYFPQQQQQQQADQRSYETSAPPPNRRSTSLADAARPFSSSGPRGASATPGWEEHSQHRQRDLLTPSGSVSEGSARQRRQASGSAQPPSANDNRLKRGVDDREDGHHAQRRKVSEGSYYGNAATVASHYNSRANTDVASREYSPIIGLKKFNNWIKSVLIGKFCARPVNARAPGAQVLDIGCGKGGDLNKWKQARISLYVGLDIADISIEQAVDRYSKMRNAGFQAYFFAHDCFSKPLSGILPEPLREIGMYDNVTMQFCMHYAFETAAKARMMIENVSRYLRKGGIFIGTIPDSQLLLDRLAEVPEDAEELRFGNDCYFVQFQERHHKGVYGHQYRFYLADAVDDVPEYIVDWDNFVSLAYEYGLKLVYKQSFNDVFLEEQSSRDFGPLLGKMGVLNDRGESSMDHHQWEAANLYMAFAFEKI